MIRFDRKFFSHLLFLTLAGVVNAVGVTMFLVPWNLLDGGLSGTGFLLSGLTAKLPLAFWLVVLNFPFFLLAWKRMGSATVLRSLYAIGIYSLSSFLIQNVFHLCGADGKTSPFVKAPSDIILAVIFGGLISGIGSGLTIRFGGAMDGVEVMGVMFSKRVGLTVGQFVMIYNAVIYIIAGVVFQDFRIPLYSIVAYAVGLKAVDFIVEGLDKGKAAFVITDRPDVVGRRISEVMGRGITMLEAKGFYSQARKGLLYCVVNRFEIGTLKRAISEVDPAAFVSVSEVSDMLGSDVRLDMRKFRREKAARHLADPADVPTDPSGEQPVPPPEKEQKEEEVD